MDIVRRLVLSGVFSAASASAQAAILYDGLSLPGPPGWVRVLLGATNSLGPEGVTLDTTQAMGLRAGYVRIDQILNATPGFTLSFRARLVDEMHGSSARAGFSVIVLDTLHRGVELGFWQGEVWAQNAGFTRGERAVFDTRVMTDYALVFTASRYTLLAGGAPLLEGALRDYGPGPPYTVPNFIFFGDDTTSASGKFTLASVALESAPAPVGLVNSVTRKKELALLARSAYFSPAVLTVHPKADAHSPTFREFLVPEHGCVAHTCTIWRTRLAQDAVHAGPRSVRAPPPGAS